MGIEITPGGEAIAEKIGTLADASIPYDERFAPGFVDHDPADGQPAGGDGLKWFWDGFARSFSDLERTTVETVATPGHLVIAVDLSGTHTGEYRGHAPTGKRFTVRMVQITRFEDGRAIERWGSTDELGILQQLGLA